jgi:hypothetical protein
MEVTTMQSTPFPRSILRAISQRRPLLMSIAALGWSTKYLIGLGLDHVAGPVIYGVLVAALAVGAAVANLAVLRTARPQVAVTVVLLGVWAVVALGGIAGVVAHVIGPVAGHGPVDLRPRPVPAPLVFTLLGFVGAGALVLGQRAAIRRGREHA